MKFVSLLATVAFAFATSTFNLPAAAQTTAAPAARKDPAPAPAEEPTRPGGVVVAPPVPGAGDGPPPLPVVEFYYALRGVQHGPVSFDELGRLFANGTLNGRTLIWRKGMAQWTPAAEDRDVAALITGPPTLPDTQWQDFMVGTWYLKTRRNNFDIEIYSTYTPDGKYTATYTFYLPDTSNPGQMITNGFEIRGTWKVEPVSGDRFKLSQVVESSSNPQVTPSKDPTVSVMRKIGLDQLYNETSRSEAKRI